PQPAPLEETRPDPTELPMAAEATPAPADPEPEPAPAEPPSAPEQAPAPPAPTAVAPTPAPVTPVPAERTAPSSRLGGSARDLVSSDGSLIEAQPKGPLAGLKAKLGG
ncbi:MAG: hypothetical protein ACO3J4_09145, partial [Vulcanococcus sp.]